MEWAAQTTLGPAYTQVHIHDPTNSYPTSLHPLPHTAPHMGTVPGHCPADTGSGGSPPPRPDLAAVGGPGPVALPHGRLIGPWAQEVALSCRGDSAAAPPSAPYGALRRTDESRAAHPGAPAGHHGPPQAPGRGSG